MSSPSPSSSSTPSSPAATSHHQQLLQQRRNSRHHHQRQQQQPNNEPQSNDDDDEKQHRRRPSILRMEDTGLDEIMVARGYRDSRGRRDSKAMSPIANNHNNNNHHSDDIQHTEQPRSSTPPPAAAASHHRRERSASVPVPDLSIDQHHQPTPNYQQQQQQQRRHTVATLPTIYDANGMPEMMDEATARRVLEELQQAQLDITRLMEQQWGTTATEFARPGRRAGKDGETFAIAGTGVADISWQTSVRRRVLSIADPRGVWRSRWDMFVILLLIYNLIDIPLTVCFDVPAEPWSAMDLLDLFVDILFLTDVVFNFRTGFYANGYLVTDSKVIRNRYLRGWFLPDLITSIPLSHIVAIFYARRSHSVLIGLPRFLRIIRLARLVKLLRVFRLMKAMNEWEPDAVHNSFSKSMKFILLVGCFAHIAACLFMLVAMLDRSIDGEFNHDSWIRQYDPNIRRPLDVSLSRRYILCMYWAITTITTVGYGDIVPITTNEMVVTCFVMFVGTCAFGYIIGNIASIISTDDDTARLIRSKIRSIGEYMRYRKLPPHLREKIKSHYEYAWRRTTVYDEDVILNELPTFLRTEVALHLNKDLIQAVPFLSDMGIECVALLVTKLKPLQIAPGNYVFYEGEIGREMYFVSEGELCVLGGDNGDKVLCVLTKGSYFGEYAILADRPPQRTASIRARAFADLYSLSKSAFQEVMAIFPELEKNIVQEARRQWEQIMAPLQAAMPSSSSQLARLVYSNTEPRLSGFRPRPRRHSMPVIDGDGEGGDGDGGDGVASSSVIHNANKASSMPLLSSSDDNASDQRFALQQWSEWMVEKRRNGRRGAGGGVPPLPAAAAAAVAPQSSSSAAAAPAPSSSFNHGEMELPSLPPINDEHEQRRRRTAAAAAAAASSSRHARSRTTDYTRRNSTLQRLRSLQDMIAYANEDNNNNI